MDIEKLKKELLSSPHKLRQKEPFTRGSSTYDSEDYDSDNLIKQGDTFTAHLPNNTRIQITQDEYLKELDPMSHKVLFDRNIPTITMKMDGGGYLDVKYARMPVSFQRNIKNKQKLHLCGNPMQFTLMNIKPTEIDKRNFVVFKQYWNKRNMDGLRTEMVDAQKSVGDAGLLFYFDYKGRIKARVLKYPEYVLCPHNDNNGDRILETIYYEKDGIKYLDSYDDTYYYHYICDGKDGSDEEGWRVDSVVKHGFNEIPLITKRGQVAWDNVQSIIEAYEVIYNVFLVIQKRYGRGLLYIKGKFKNTGKKIDGAFVLNDTSMDGKGSAEFKAPPSPQNMIETLEMMEQTIQKFSSTTFLLPKDVKSSGDISALAIMLTQSLDIENATSAVIEWQNVADKMCRLFLSGLSKELVNNKTNEFAATEFAKLNIDAKFKVWRPQNDYEYNQMLGSAYSTGGISRKTFTEKCTISTPDEEMRIRAEKEEELKNEEIKTIKVQENTTSEANKQSTEIKTEEEQK